MEPLSESGHDGHSRGHLPSHALTTLYYLARHHGSRHDVEAAIDTFLKHFEIFLLDQSDWGKDASSAL